MKISSIEVLGDDRCDSKYSDFRYATETHAIPLPKEFYLLGELLSEHHDEGEYFWLIQDMDKKYYILSGAHDYTGWDCISHCTIGKAFDSLDEIHLHVPATDNQDRPVRKLLLEQANADIKSS